MDTTFRYLISVAVSQNLEMRLMDVVIAYLYGDLDTEIYMKIPEGFTLPKAKPMSMYSIQLRRSLYGLKQSGRMWYNHLSEYLSKRGHENNPICLCLFIKKILKAFVIVAIYVDDINLIGTLEEQVLQRFGMDKAHPLSTPLVIRSLDIKKDPYHPIEENEEVLGLKVPYLSVNGALMYLAQCIRPNISFSVNILAKYSSAPTQRH